MKTILASAILASCLISSMAVHGQTALKDTFRSYFLIGVAINRAQFSGDDTVGSKIIETQFNSKTS